jgi:hypothetical protein
MICVLRGGARVVSLQVCGHACAALSLRPLGDVKVALPATAFVPWASLCRLYEGGLQWGDPFLGLRCCAVGARTLTRRERKSENKIVWQSPTAAIRPLTTQGPHVHTVRYERSRLSFSELTHFISGISVRLHVAHQVA